MNYSLLGAIKELAFKEGAPLLGIAPAHRFFGAPQGHHPKDLLKGASSVIVVGMPIPASVSCYDQLLTASEVYQGDIRKKLLQANLYKTMGYHVINNALANIAYKIGLKLMEERALALPLPPTMVEKGEMAIFSHRHAAVRAGLGEFGLNNVVITRQFGPRARFVSIITDATLEPTPLLEKKVCLGVEECNLCIDECGPLALALNPEIDHNEVWLNPVSRTDMGICREKREAMFCYGRCLRVCPVGLPSPFHVHRS